MPMPPRGRWNSTRIAAAVVLLVLPILGLLSVWPGRELSPDQWGGVGLLISGVALYLLYEIHDATVDQVHREPRVYLTRASAYEAAFGLLSAVTPQSASGTRIFVASFVDLDQSGPRNSLHLTELLVRCAAMGASVEEMYLLTDDLTPEQIKTIGTRIARLADYPTATVRMGSVSHRTLSYAPMSVGSTILVGLYGSVDSNYIDSAIELPGSADATIERVFSTFRGAAPYYVLLNMRVQYAALKALPGTDGISELLKAYASSASSESQGEATPQAPDANNGNGQPPLN